jgi:hypothetical protein
MCQLKIRVTTLENEKKGDKWSLSRSTKEEPQPWSSTNTWQVKPWEVVEGNKKEDQTTTPTTHEVIDSRGTSSKGIGDGEKSCIDGEEGRVETSSRDYHESYCKNQF